MQGLLARAGVCVVAEVVSPVEVACFAVPTIKEVYFSQFRLRKEAVKVISIGGIVEKRPQGDETKPNERCELIVLQKTLILFCLPFPQMRACQISTKSERKSDSPGKNVFFVRIEFSLSNRWGFLFFISIVSCECLIENRFIFLLFLLVCFRTDFPTIDLVTNQKELDISMDSKILVNQDRVFEGEDNFSFSVSLLNRQKKKKKITRTLSDRFFSLVETRRLTCSSI